MIRRCIFLALLLIVKNAFSIPLCPNGNCEFEYLGATTDGNRSEKDLETHFLNSPYSYQWHELRYPKLINTHKRLNVLLFRLERAFTMGDAPSLEGRIGEVADFWKSFERDCADTGGNAHTRTVRLILAEQIEYSIARMILAQKHSADCRMDASVINRLIPDEIYNRSEGQWRVKDNRVFKRMLILALHIQRWREMVGRLPQDMKELLENECSGLRVLVGTDIEYRARNGVWELRRRSNRDRQDKNDFDKYIPVVGFDRKGDLCLSSTYNEKRASLFRGAVLYEDDEVMACTVRHGGQGIGNQVHKISYMNPHAGRCEIRKVKDETDLK